MSITIEQIKDLRDKTGAGMGSVKEALESTNGDEEKAIQYLREKGLAKSVKRAGKEAVNGIMGVYRHHDRRMVVVVEVATETDFTSRSADLQKFADDIALHIAANSTEYASIEAIPAEIIEKEKAVFASDVEGKPAEIAEKIMSGRLEKFYAEKVLLKQKLFTDETKTVQDYLNEIVAKVGEKVEITRFVMLKIATPTISSGL